MHPTLASPTTPIEHYTLTLPWIPLLDLEGQRSMFAVDGAPLPELVALPELADVDVRQGVLSGFGGVLAVRTWVRGKRKRVPWDQLDLQLGGIDKHRGRKWKEWDDRTMAAVRRQTWNAADLGQRRIAPPIWWETDAMVSPKSGELVQYPRNQCQRRLFEILWAAYEEGAGGVMLSKPEWAQRLHCCVRSVYNHMRGLMRSGWGRLIPTWRKRVGDKPGSGREHLLMRIGPTAEDLAGIEPLARRSCLRSGVDVSHALLLAVELRKRMRLRAYHVSGSHWRHQRAWRETSEHGRAGVDNFPRAGRRRSVKDRATVGSTLHSPPRAPLSDRQTMPNSPPLVTVGPPVGGTVERAPYGRSVFHGAPPAGAGEVVHPSPTNAAPCSVLARRAGKSTPPLDWIPDDPGVSADFLAEYCR